MAWNILAVPFKQTNHEIHEIHENSQAMSRRDARKTCHEKVIRLPGLRSFQSLFDQRYEHICFQFFAGEERGHVLEGSGDHAAIVKFAGGKFGRESLAQIEHDFAHGRTRRI